MFPIAARQRRWLLTSHLLRSCLPEQIQTAMRLSRSYVPVGDDYQRLIRFVANGRGRLLNHVITPILMWTPLGELYHSRKIHLYRSRAAKKKDSKKKKKKLVRRRRGRPQKKKIPQVASFGVRGSNLKLWLKESKLRRAVS